MALCPDCGSPGSFHPWRRRPTEGQLEVVITCKLCPWEQVLHSGPEPVVLVELDLDKLRGRAQRQPELASLIAARERRLAELRRKYGLES